MADTDLLAELKCGFDSWVLSLICFCRFKMVANLCLGTITYHFFLCKLQYLAIADPKVIILCHFLCVCKYMYIWMILFLLETQAAKNYQSPLINNYISSRITMYDPLPYCMSSPSMAGSNEHVCQTRHRSDQALRYYIL